LAGWRLSAAGVTHIISLSGAGPYGLVGSFHDFVLGVLYGVLGLLTNFGANPAFDATQIKNIDHDALHRLSGLGGISYLVNFMILAVAAFAVWRLIRISFSFNSRRTKTARLDGADRLSIWLIWTSAAALLLFIFTNHYYAVDARYLTIAVFAFFIALAAYSRRLAWKAEALVVIGLVIVASILYGSIGVVRVYSTDKAVLRLIDKRNSLIAQALDQHPVKALVGDYWRVIPTKQLSGGKINVMPLSGCFTARNTLSSQAWQIDLHNNSFAYLLSLDRSLTDYRNCTLDEVVARYGQPNSSVLVAGSLSSPKELLLFYDRGIHKSLAKISIKSPSTILPISLDELPYTSCSVPSVFSVVAHQDDDLLFMNPDLLHDIRAGHCIRTVYLTAGDAGSSQVYWLGRQQGSEAAYSKMLGVDDIWVERTVKLADNEYITVANPRGGAKVSLIFMHLPDGNITGQGFAATNFESLARLEAGEIGAMNSVDGQSAFTSDQLVAALSSLMHVYQPTEIRTQANYAGGRFPDHSDHQAVGRYVKRAYQQYENEQFENKIAIPIKFYLGYPIHQFPPNVSDGDLIAKSLTFFTYAQFDRGVCGSSQECARNPAYGASL
jgi:LmbE family N-acetylglucosaminyl deacetylase